MKMIEIPEIKNYGKEKGINGLIQIAEQSRENTVPQRIEIITRYFSKLQNRMEKAGNSITDEEENEIRTILMEIVTKVE